MSTFAQEFLNAAGQGDTARLHTLLRDGADLNSRDGLGRTALMLAAKHGHSPTIQWLIEARADTALYDDEGFTALDYTSPHYATSGLEDRIRQCREYLMQNWRETYLRRRPIPALIARDFLEAYSHVEGHAAFRLMDGSYHEGYFGVEGDHVNFWHGVGPMELDSDVDYEALINPDEIIPIDEIDIDSLYW